MAYNLRPCRIRDELLEELEERVVEENSEDEGEIHENSSGNESDSAESDGSGASELEDVEMEDASEQQRLLNSRARGRPSTKLKGKNGFVWDTRAPSRASDRFLGAPPTPGPKGNALNCNSLEEFWSCLFNQEMFTMIVNSTNIKIEEECAMLVAEGKTESYHHHTDETEIRAFIGILYYAGLWKSSDVNDNRLWSKENGVTLYRCAFSRQRFGFLSSCIRFDDVTSRNREDIFAPFRAFWDIFIANCRDNYNPSRQCTVDEQLLSFRGRCKFRVYMKDKPDKYGLEIISLNDAETSYMINAIPYLGKNTAIVQREEAVPEYYFRLVTEPIYNTNRSVTSDNWYTSIPLLQRMLKDPYNIKITGTIRKNKREIPEDFKVAPKERPSTKFCHAENLTLLSYAPKKKKSKKIVLIVSSFMHTIEITDEKSNIVRHYNRTKGGTDNFDKLCHSFTVSGRTDRWPIRYFYGTLDQSIVNARILYVCFLRNNNNNKKVSAIECLDTIYKFLLKPFLENRYLTVTLRRELKVAIGAILKKDNHVQPQQKRLEYPTKQRCAFCTRKQDKKTKYGCPSCQRPICQEHSVLLCDDCSGF